MTTSSSPKGSADVFLILDILAHALRNAENLAKAGSGITQQLRDLTGARTALLIQCLDEYADHEHKVVAASPSRRQTLIEPIDVERIAELTHDLVEPMRWNVSGDDGPAQRILSDLGIGDSIGAPLMIGSSRVGCLLLLDVPDDAHGLPLVLDMLDMLSATIALVFRNSLLYEQQEVTIAQRTAELEQSNNALRAEMVERESAIQSLRDSEQRFKCMFESLSSGAAILDPVSGGRDFVFVDFNPAAQKLDQVAREDAIGQRVGTVFPSFETSGLLDVFRRVWRSGQAEHYPVALYHEQRDAEFFENFVYKLPSGEIVVIYDDVTDRKRMELELVAEKTLSEAYINSLPGLFYVFDQQRFIRWNEQWGKVTGYSQQEVAGKYGPDFFEGEDRTHIGESMLRVFREGIGEVEADLVTKDGRRIPYYFTGARKTFDGKDYLVGLGVDISKRRLIQRELEKHREHLEELVRERAAELAVLSAEQQLILDSVRAMIWHKDTQNNNLRVNKAAADLIGRSVQEMEGKSSEELFPQDAARYYQDDLQVIRSGRPKLGIEEPLRTASGEELWLLTDKIPIVDQTGAVTGIIVFSIDITQRKRTQERAEQRTQELRTILSAMAGRENRMAELKGVIKELRAQLQQAGMTPVADDPLLGDVTG